MQDHDLDAIALRRVLTLSETGLLGGVALSELATLAGNAVEVELPAGSLVATAGARVAAVHVVIDGSLVASGGSGWRWHRHDIFGAVHVFADRAARHDVRAAVATRTLQIDAEDLTDLFDDNFGVLVATIRAVAARLADGGIDLSPATPAVVGVPLGLVDRLFLLRRQLPFTHGSVRALASLAGAATEQTWPAGAVVARAGDPATCAWWLGDGEVRILDSDREIARLGAGSAVGLVEMLAGGRHRTTIETTATTHALAATAAALVDVIEDHTELGIDVLAALSRELLDRNAT